MFSTDPRTVLGVGSRKHVIKKADLSPDLACDVLAATAHPVAEARPDDLLRSHILTRGRRVIAALDLALQRLGAAHKIEDAQEAVDLINRHYDGLFGLEHQSRARMSFLNLIRLQAGITIGTLDQHADAVIQLFGLEFAEEAKLLVHFKVRTAIDVWRRSLRTKSKRAAPYMKAVHAAVADFDLSVRENDEKSLTKEWSRKQPPDARRPRRPLTATSRKTMPR